MLSLPQTKTPKFLPIATDTWDQPVSDSPSLFLFSSSSGSAGAPRGRFGGERERVAEPLEGTTLPEESRNRRCAQGRSGEGSTSSGHERQELARLSVGPGGRSLGVAHLARLSGARGRPEQRRVGRL